MTEPIPDVCFTEDVARILRTSRRTIWRLRKAGTFPIAEMKLDGRPRWRGADVRRFIEMPDAPRRQPLWGKRRAS